MTFEDLLYEVKNGVAWITINRPDKMNAFRGTTCDELIKALNNLIKKSVLCPSLRHLMKILVCCTKDHYGYIEILI